MHATIVVIITTELRHLAVADRTRFLLHGRWSGQFSFTTDERVEIVSSDGDSTTGDGRGGDERSGTRVASIGFRKEIRGGKKK